MNKQFNHGLCICWRILTSQLLCMKGKPKIKSLSSSRINKSYFSLFFLALLWEDKVMSEQNKKDVIFMYNEGYSEREIIEEYPGLDPNEILDICADEYESWLKKS